MENHKFILGIIILLFVLVASFVPTVYASETSDFINQAVNNTASFNLVVGSDTSEEEVGAAINLSIVTGIPAVLDTEAEGNTNLILIGSEEVNSKTLELGNSSLGTFYVYSGNLFISGDSSQNVQTIESIINQLNLPVVQNNSNATIQNNTEIINEGSDNHQEDNVSVNNSVENNSLVSNGVLNKINHSTSVSYPSSLNQTTIIRKIATNNNQSNTLFGQSDNSGGFNWSTIIPAIILIFIAVVIVIIFIVSFLRRPKEPE